MDDSITPHVQYEAWATLVRSVLRQIVAHPDELGVHVNLSIQTPHLFIRCADADVARVIGRFSRTVDAITTLTRAWSWRHDLPLRIEVLGARKPSPPPTPIASQEAPTP